MYKKFLTLVICVAIASSMVACGDVQQENSDNIEVIDFEELTANVIVEEQNTKERYENFLKGEEPLYFNQYMPRDYEGIRFETNKGYTMSELLAVLKGKYIDVDIDTEINYAYLDCGNDGVEELAFRFNGISVEGPEISTQVYVIKEIEGKLECCYYYETWSRSNTDINCYGYVTSSGSNGASNHGYDAGYIDADGNWNFIHYTEEEWNIEGFGWNEELSKLSDIAASKQYEGYIVVTTTRFEEILTDEDYYNMKNYYAYYVDGVEGDVYSDGIYKDIFAEAGVKMYRPEEIEAMILEKEASLGITEEIKQGAEVSWEDIP